VITPINQVFNDIITIFLIPGKSPTPVKSILKFCLISFGGLLHHVIAHLLLSNLSLMIMRKLSLGLKED